MIKSGDKLLGKGSFGGNIYTGEVDTDDNTIFISNISNYDAMWFRLYKPKITQPYQITDGLLYIWDHFYTLQEMRKLKLEKINEI